MSGHEKSPPRHFCQGGAFPKLLSFKLFHQTVPLTLVFDVTQRIGQGRDFGHWERDALSFQITSVEVTLLIGADLAHRQSFFIVGANDFDFQIMLHSRVRVFVAGLVTDEEPHRLIHGLVLVRGECVLGLLALLLLRCRGDRWEVPFHRLQFHGDYSFHSLGVFPVGVSKHSMGRTTQRGE